MNSLFTIDNTDNIVSYVKEQIKQFKSLNGKCDEDMTLHFIREGVSKYSSELKFHERIKYVEYIYKEWFDEYNMS